MKRQEELAVGGRLLGHIERRTNDLADAMFRNRVDAYASRDRAALERDRLFRERPILVGPSSRLPGTGDYLTEDVAGMPVLMVRGGDGTVRAFANICRHRGAPVAEGCGNARAFSCPYHGWTYDAQGSLVGVTDKVGFAGLDAAAHGLVRLPAAERHGLLFVRPSPLRDGEAATIDVDDWLGDFSHTLGALDLARFPLHSTDRVRPALNWKFAIDTFLEGYHIPHLHRRTIAPYFIGNVGTFDAAGPHGRMCVPRNSIETQRPLAEDSRAFLPHIIALYQVFPNAVLIWQVDHVELWRAFPDRTDPGRCEVELTLYRPEPTDRPAAYWEKNRDIAIRTVLDEDFPLGERMQIGFESGATNEVIYGRNEPSLVHFHRSIRDALGVAA